MALPKSLTTVTTFSKILALFLFILLPFAGFYAGYKYRAGTYVPTPIVQNNPVPIPNPYPTSTNQTIDTSTWKTYENNFFSILYPSSWIPDTKPSQKYNLAFTNSDYKDDGGAPTITNGFKVYLYIYRGYGRKLNDKGLIESTETTLLGTKAFLEKITWEGATVKLRTDGLPKIDIAFMMHTPPLEKPAFKTFEQNKEVFMAVANSLKLKQ
ncbi:MAG: hypothetical protein AAB675_04650 [Patescibacteria group bacterium]